MADVLNHERPACPFCPYSVASQAEREMYFLLEHLEIAHPENGESPFTVKDSGQENHRDRPEAGIGSNSDTRRKVENSAEGATRDHSDDLSDDDTNDYFIECPMQCGEAIHNRELGRHMELHEAEITAVEADLPDICRSLQSPSHSILKAASVSRKTTSPAIEPHNSNGKLPPPPRNTSTAAPEKPRARHSAYSAFSALGNLKELFLSPAPRKTRSSHTKPKSGPRRLGRTELGPYAYEEKMPTWLYRQLETGPKIKRTSHVRSDGEISYIEEVANEVGGAIPVLRQLCLQDNSVRKAYLCHPTVKHIFKMPREGGFCGYRNIQMLVSFIQGTKFQGYERFPASTPSVLLLQDLIEEAWDKGINKSGRIETGGIRGTRKYIGTPEAQALFESLDIGCDAVAFNSPKSKVKEKPRVHDRVLQNVLEYFESGTVVDNNRKVYQTDLAPLYFQHPGHSLTIVGIEIRDSGAMNLLVFDPMFKTASGVVRLIGSKPKLSSSPERLLKSFRLGHRYLRKYNSFEILKLTE